MHSTDDYYDYIIVGGGPTGISTTLMLTEQSTTKVLLVDADQELGGNWKAEWCEGYHIEHSPKVLFSSHQYIYDLMKYLNVTPKLRKVYSKSNKRLISDFTRKYFTITDVLKMSWGVRYYFTNYYKDIDTWMDDIQLSTKAKHGLRMMCILIANVPTKMCIGGLIESIIPLMFACNQQIVQFSRPNEWIEAATDELRRRSNVTVLTNSAVKRIHESNEGIVIGEELVCYGKQIVCCVPIKQLYVMIQESPQLHENWFDSIDAFKAFSHHSSYVGLGVQLHFDQEMDHLTDNLGLCWSCAQAWNIIVVPKEHILETYSKDPNVKSVWSCVIIDHNAYSFRLAKQVIECTMEEIIDEIVYQLSIVTNTTIRPYKITMYESPIYPSGYSNRFGPFPMVGTKVSTIYAVGPHTTGRIATIEEGLKSSIDFAKHIGLQQTIYSQKPKWIVYVFIVFMLFMIWFKKNIQ